MEYVFQYEIWELLIKNIITSSFKGSVNIQKEEGGPDMI